jgi:GNAT superfamily N-acetyltransferase
VRVEPSELAIEAALESERAFVLTLGGFALEVAGARLVTHEKIPAPRFNFVQELGVGRERQTAFFERALDHYFQRALRPTFRVPDPPPAHVDRGLRALGFVPRAAPLVLLLENGEPPAAPDAGVRVREATASDLDEVASFWSDERERPELRTAIDVGWHHPNPHEQLVPLVASIDGEAVAAAIAYRYRAAAGVHFVATRPPARGRGAASALVAYALLRRPVGPEAFLSMFADSSRLLARLGRLGLSPARSFTEYELPRNAELALPPPGPPGPPWWRPPRPPRGSGRD